MACSRIPRSSAFKTHDMPAHAFPVGLSPPALKGVRSKTGEIKKIENEGRTHDLYENKGSILGTHDVYDNK